MAKKETVTPKLDPRIAAIADKIKRIRKDKGYGSYEAFAIEMGISRILYWRLEKGVNFTITSLLKVLDAHQMTLAEFFEDIE